MAGFGLAVLPICLTPGVSFTLVTQRVLARGPRHGLLVTAGTSCGLVCHATLAGVGLSAIVLRSATAFTVVKLAGAGYLLVTGAGLLWKSRPRRGGGQTMSDTEISAVPRRLPWQVQGDFARGLLGNVLNPKAAAVYLTLAPQFIRAGHPVLAQMMALCAAHVFVAAGWLTVWTAVVDVSRRTVRSRRFRRIMDRMSGAVLIGLGIRAAAVTR